MHITEMLNGLMCSRGMERLVQPKAKAAPLIISAGRISIACHARNVELSMEATRRHIFARPAQPIVEVPAEICQNASGFSPP